jgi:hypothetical protein
VVEVGLRFDSGERFFRVRNDPAGAYQVLGTATAPSSACTTPDSSLDTPRSLF